MSKGFRTTLQDIAQRVGVTKMTVSRYLKTPQSVAPATRAKIQSVIDEMGYVPNRASVMLSQSSTQTIGLAVSSFSNLLFSDLIEGVEEQARRKGYDVLIAHTSYLVEEEERKVLQLLSYQVDALILTDTQHSPNLVKNIKMAKLPVVELMSYLKHPLDLNIGYDHLKVSYVAIRGLIERGRRKIAYLRARMDQRTLERQKGYELACKEAGIPIIIYGSDVHSNFSRGADMMRKALDEIADLDAVFCTNDDVAIGAMIACIEAGIKVPEKIAVLGYNGLNIGATTNPKLSSICTARRDMGRMAVDLIMKSLNQEDNYERRIELSPMLSLGHTLLPEEHTHISRLFDRLYAIKLPKID